MRIVKIEPKDIHVTIELSMRHVKMILDFLAHSTADFDSVKEPDMPLAADYVKDFYRNLNDAYENFKDAVGPDSAE